MTVAQTRRAFLKAIRDNVKSRAAKKGIRLSKEYLDEIVISQATDALCGDTAQVLNERLDQLLDMC